MPGCRPVEEFARPRYRYRGTVIDRSEHPPTGQNLRVEVLERNIVVEILFAARRSRRRRLIVLVPSWGTAAGAALSAAARAASATTSPTTAGTTTEHLHIVGDDLGGEAIIPLLVLPFSGPQLAFDEHLRALAQVFGGDLPQTTEQGDAVPFGAFLLCSGGLVLPGLAGGDADIRDRHAAGHGPGLRVCAEITHQNHFIDTARHDEPLKFGPHILYTRRQTPKSASAPET